MKSQGLTVKPQVYTMLFVACGNSHSPEDGLRRANKLREEIQIKGVPLNERHYHAMIRGWLHSLIPNNNIKVLFIYHHLYSNLKFVLFQF